MSAVAEALVAAFATKGVSARRLMVSNAFFMMIRIKIWWIITEK
jgi:hypothetical protein